MSCGTLSLLFLIQYTLANSLSTMTARAQRDALAPSAFFLLDDLPWETSGNQLTASGWTLDSTKEVESQNPDFISLFFAGNEIKNCQNGAERPGISSSRFRRSLALFNKRRAPISCGAKQLE